MKETMPANQKAHFVKIDSRSHAVISGVEDVELFSGEKILAVTSQGSITLTGEGMQVESLNISEGDLVIHGKINGFFYDERAPKAKGVFARLLR